MDTRKQMVLSLVGFTFGLQDGHRCGVQIAREDGSADWGCGVAFKELLVETLLDGGDKPLLGGVGAEG